MEIRLELDQAQIDALVDEDPEVEELLYEVADEIAETARQLAPKDDGDAAASIHAEVHRGHNPDAHAATYTPETDEPMAYVGWDQDHFYLLFHEIGTEDLPARPFMRPALDQARI